MILKQFILWCRDRMTPKSILLTVAFATGLVTGAFAALLKWLIALITNLLTFHVKCDGPEWLLLIIPLVGILLTGIYVRYILRNNVEHGVEQLVVDIKNDKPDMPPKLIYGPVIASSLTLGFGGSAGSEGPIAYTGAAIGSNMARWFGLSPQLVMIMVGCGAGAGIAGIFKAPVGGMLFTLEVLKMQMTTLSVMALVIAALTSAVTAYVLSGCTFDVSWADHVQFSPSIIPWVIALGIFCGLYSYYYSAVMKKMGKSYLRIKNPWMRNLVSGGVLAALVFLFPSLYGEGYGVVTQIINGHSNELLSHTFLFADINSVTVLIVVSAGILAVKCWAASAANSGGGVAGDFAPTLFAGAVAGLFFGTVAQKYAGADISPAIFALLGMAAVMAGAIRAPLMSIFLVLEMADCYAYFLPVVVVATVSYGVVKALSPESFYSAKKIRIKNN